MKKQSAVLTALVEKRELDAETWLRMIEARVEESIKPYLDKFTLWTLGSINIEGPEGKLGASHHNLSADAPRFTSESYSVKTQGIFYVSPSEDKTHQQEFVFGLTRAGDWIVAAIQLENCGMRKHWVGWTGRKRTIEERPYYRATDVKVTLSDPREICGWFWESSVQGCAGLYSLLNSAVYSWQQRLAEAYNQASAVTKQIEFDQAVIDIITQK